MVAAFTVRRGLAWLVLLPGAALLPVYLWNARVAPRLMWWSRRFVAVAVPMIVLLIAIALAWLIVRRGRHRLVGQIAGVTFTIGLTVAFLLQSAPVSSHREFAGSWGFLERIDGLAGGEQAVFLWQAPTADVANEPARNFGGPLWFVHDQVSAYLPTSEPTIEDVETFAVAFPRLDVFVLTTVDQLPPSLDGTRFEPRGSIQASLSVWDESTLARPAEAETLDQTVWAWQLTDQS